MELKDLKSFKALSLKDTTLASQVELVYNLTKETINGISRCYDNYTMHDMNHGLRVAAYMEDIAFGIDADADARMDAFNGLELALMLLSAILHDIGMFITKQDMQDIKNNIIRHNSGSVTFEGVLKVVSNETEAVKEIVRLTHAARIEEFINFHFDGGQTIANILQLNGKYPYWEDLVLICKAHGEDYSFISSMRTELTKGEYTYNLQYLAAILRIADLLDLDRQRTPILWYSMMELKGFSRDEWEKHFIIQNEKKFKSHLDGKIQIYFDGKSNDAKIHRKYLRYIDQLREELERADNLLNYRAANPKYKLLISTKVDDRVQTEGFKYADLRLNLDYSSITELLMGQNIYGDSRLGLRELIQNSIDACKLMKEVNSGGLDYPDPSITVSFSENKNYVKVKDTGIGMTLDVVKKHFLNVGKSYYKSNAYQYENHTYQPIGQYGIGFLACFLLSNTVQVKTKHYSSSEINHIELERDSEYVVTNTEKTGNFWGTEITLEYKKFFEIFKSERNVELFLSQYFFTDIPIYLQNDDTRDGKKQIRNACEQILSNLVKAMSKEGQPEEIDLDQKSKVLTGKIKIWDLEKFKNIKVHTFPETVYLYDKNQIAFKPIQSVSLNSGYYTTIAYTDLEEGAYDRIRSAKKSVSQKRNEILALSRTERKVTALLFNDEADIDIYGTYMNDGELKIDGTKISEILSNSGLKYYEELLDDIDDYMQVFAAQNKYIYVHYCSFEKYMRPHHSKGDLEMAFLLYNKGVYVNDFRRFRCPYPAPVKGAGYIQYFGNELRLDVSRKNLIAGEAVLENQITQILLRDLKEKIEDAGLKQVVGEMLRCAEEEKLEDMTDD